jgi:hypothetical protein
MSLRPHPIGPIALTLPPVLPRDIHGVRAGHLAALLRALDQVAEENPRFLLFLLVGPLVSQQQPFPDRDRDRDRPPHVIEPGGIAAKVQVPVTALIPVTIADQVVDGDIIDIALLCLGHPVLKRLIAGIEEF